MYGTSFIAPQETMTLMDITRYKLGAIQAGIDHMLALAIASSDANLVVRDIRANADLGYGTALENEWTFNLVAGADTVFAAAAANPANRAVVFYGIDDFDANPVATLVTFRTAAVGGTTKMLVDLQNCRGFTYCAGMLSEPVVYDPQETVVISIQTDAANLEQIKFLGYVIEPRGTVVS